MSKVTHLSVVKLGGQKKLSNACCLAGHCPLRVIMDRYPNIELSSIYIAASTIDGKGVEGHSEIRVCDINTLMRLLDRMSMKLHNLYQKTLP